MSDKSVDAFLRTEKLVPDWYVMNKVLQKPDVVFSNDVIDFDDIVT